MKTIIFCADGTWNGPEGKTSTSPIDAADNRGELPEVAVTHVIKLFSNLAGHVTPETMSLSHEQEKLYVDNAGRARQAVKYMHGVGDSSNPINRFLGGVFGMGVIARIVRGYTFHLAQLRRRRRDSLGRIQPRRPIRREPSLE